MPMIDVTKFCNNCMHGWVNNNDGENDHCKECNWSDEQKTMINYEQIPTEEDFK